MNLTHEANNYGQSLSAYIENFKLPRQWFEHADHIAVKAANAQHYERLIAQFKPQSQEIYESELNDRRIATAFLAGPIAVASQWQVSLLEIMEPRPAMIGRDKVGLDHMEFFYPDLVAIEDRLEVIAGIIPVPQPKPGHNTLSIIFGKQNELKFTDRRLADVIRAERQTTNRQ